MSPYGDQNYGDQVSLEGDARVLYKSIPGPSLSFLQYISMRQAMLSSCSSLFGAVFFSRHLCSYSDLDYYLFLKSDVKLVWSR